MTPRRPLRIDATLLSRPAVDSATRGIPYVLVLAGLAGVAFDNWRRCRRDEGWLRTLAEASPAPPPSPETWTSCPRVSVLVAGWNEARNIEDHIRSFQDLRYPFKELVICAGGDDGSFAEASRLAGPAVIVLEQQPGEGKQHSLQRCLSRAGGDVILLTDADCTFTEDAFLRLIEPIALGQAQVVTGVSKPLSRQLPNALVQYQRFNDLLWSRQMPQRVDGVLGRNCALLRPVLEAIGAFDSPVSTGTDYFLSRLLTRAGYEIHSAPDSCVATEYPGSPRAYLRMWRRWNKNLLIHGFRFGAWKDVRGVLVAFAIYSHILSAPVLTLAIGPLALVTPLTLFGMASANRFRRLRAGTRLAGMRVPWRCLVGLPFYASLEMVAVVLAVRDCLHPKLRSQW
jgi:glycosyltransferase involved in cell wall biosynthesis